MAMIDRAAKALDTTRTAVGYGMVGATATTASTVAVHSAWDRWYINNFDVEDVGDAARLPSYRYAATVGTSGGLTYLSMWTMDKLGIFDPPTGLKAAVAGATLGVVPAAMVSTFLLREEIIGLTQSDTAGVLAGAATGSRVGLGSPITTTRGSGPVTTDAVRPE